MDPRRFRIIFLLTVVWLGALGNILLLLWVLHYPANRDPFVLRAVIGAGTATGILFTVLVLLGFRHYWPKDAQSPRSLYLHFVSGTSGSDIVAAANDIQSCLAKKDAASEQLLDLLKPKVQVPRTGPTGRPLLDLTGGRPDTPQWIAYRTITDQDNPNYEEYMAWIRRCSGSFHRRWIRTILEHLSTTSEVDWVRQECKGCLGAL